MPHRNIQVLFHFKTKADIWYLKSTKSCTLKVLFRKRNNSEYTNCTNRENQVHLIGYPTCMSHFKRFFANKMFLSIRNRYLYCTMCRQRIVKIYLYDFCNFDVTVIAVSFVHQQMVMSFKLTTLQLSFTSELLCANFNGYF